MPPIMMASITGTSTTGSAANPARPSAYVEKPALLNADTAWKAPCHNARPNGSP